MAAATATAAAAKGTASRPLPAYMKISPTDIHFRLVSPATSSGRIIGRKGQFLRLLREETGARIHVEDPVKGECIVHIVADKGRSDGDAVEGGPSAAQRALAQVFPRIIEDEEAIVQDMQVIGRLLVPWIQAGCVLGKGGKIVERIRHESGAHVRVLSGENVPPCASQGDEVIQIVGPFSAVMRALLAVSSCLQDNSRTETSNYIAKPSGVTIRGPGYLSHVDSHAPSPRSFLSSVHVSDHHSSYLPKTGTPNIGPGHRRMLEEEVVFRLLCTNEKARSIIGKVGLTIHALQSETGASIRVLDEVVDSDERIILISSYENVEWKTSPAQEAVLRVHRLTEVAFEKALVVARLLVPSQQIGCLLGKDGTGINELSRVTRANIWIFSKEHVPKCAQPNDEVLQVSGEFKCVQDALLYITSRIREIIFHTTHNLSTAASQHMTPTFEVSPLLRTRADIISYGPFSNTVSQGPDPSIGLSYGSDSLGSRGFDHVSYPYGVQTAGYHPALRHSSLPKPWLSQAVNTDTPRSIRDPGTGLLCSTGSENQTPNISTVIVEVMVPQHLLRLVYGENGRDFTEIQEISGARITINDPKSGATEGIVLISGTHIQTYVARSLLQAYVLHGKSSF